MKIVCLLLVGVLVSFSCKEITNKLDKSSAFEALSGDSGSAVGQIQKQINQLPQSAENRAWLGALTMKEAGFQSTVKDKLTVFNSGKKLLETEIKKDLKNAEFRFLRLMIQENSPKTLRYNNQIEEDAQQILNGFSKLNPALQKLISNYSKQSKRLKSAHLN